MTTEMKLNIAKLAFDLLSLLTAGLLAMSYILI